MTEIQAPPPLSQLKPGDVVAFKRDGKVFMRKVARTDATTLWVSVKSADGAPTDTAISRGDLVGRMLFKVSLGKLKP